MDDINVTLQTSWYKNKKKLFIAIRRVVLALIVLVFVIIVLTKKDKKCNNCDSILPQCKDECSNNPCKCDPSAPECVPYTSYE